MATKQNLVVLTDKESKALGREIVELHKKAVDVAEDAIGAAVQCGDALVKAKEGVPHGKWEAWLEMWCPRVSIRTAQRWMELSREWNAVSVLEVDTIDVSVAGLLSEVKKKPREQPVETQATLPDPPSEPPPTGQKRHDVVFEDGDAEVETLPPEEDTDDDGPVTAEMVKGKLTAFQRSLAKMLSDLQEMSSFFGTQDASAAFQVFNRAHETLARLERNLKNLRVTKCRYGSVVRHERSR